ncbi:hypothetical protein DFH08DRAFT_1001374 [Mycena albidolilacea]|uniref:Uncharacterized protein n=1 Tax=Mycena albidolilacea TaxID=1033008 RepID=A0AAD7A391_9AGAR|nr:hypothetical protein DFH08DRAFT_1001374 [Mycena albidolilacea]
MRVSSACLITLSLSPLLPRRLLSSSTADYPALDSLLCGSPCSDPIPRATQERNAAVKREALHECSTYACNAAQCLVALSLSPLLPRRHLLCGLFDELSDVATRDAAPPWRMRAPNYLDRTILPYGLREEPAHLSVSLPSIGVSFGRALEGKARARAGRQSAHGRAKAGATCLRCVALSVLVSPPCGTPRSSHPFDSAGWRQEMESAWLSLTSILGPRSPVSVPPLQPRSFLAGRPPSSLLPSSPSLLHDSGHFHPVFSYIPSPPLIPFPEFCDRAVRRRGTEDPGAARSTLRVMLP